MRNLELYPLEYRRTRCLKCAKPISEHGVFTAELIERVKGATYEKPIEGYRAPVSPTLIGQWLTHEPMPWSKEAQQPDWNGE
jgi:hypothetical protein